MKKLILAVCLTVLLATPVLAQYQQSNNRTGAQVDAAIEVARDVGSASGIIKCDGADTCTAASDGTDYLSAVASDTDPALGGPLDLANEIIHDTANAFGGADATPDVSGGTIFKTGGADTYTDFDDGTDHTTLVDGQLMIILFQHAASLDCTSSQINCNSGNDWTASDGDAAFCTFDDTTDADGQWVCIISASAPATWAELPALTDSYIIVGNGSNQAAAVAMSGDVAIANTGATTIQDDKILESHLKAVDAAVDEDILTKEDTTGDYEWHSYAEVKTGMSLDNVENTALTGWVGTTAITTLGTVATGTWEATDVDGDFIGIVGTDSTITSRDSEDFLIVYSPTGTLNQKITVGNFVTGLGGGGSPVVFDIGDDGGNDSTDLAEIAISTGDTNSVFTLNATDKMLIDVTKDWPGADEADTLTTALTHELGGMETDVSGYTNGVYGMLSGVTADIDTAAELETAAGLGAFANEYLDDDDQSAMQTTLALVPGTNVQVYNDDLDALAVPTAWRMFYSDAADPFIQEITLGADGTFLESNGVSAAPAFRALVAGDIPDISATYEVQLTNEAGLYAVLDDVTMFMEDMVDDVSPQLGGDLDVNGQEIQSSGNVIVQLGAADGSSYLEIQNSSSIAAHRFFDDGTWGPAESGDPYLLFNDDTLTTEFVIYAKDTTTDVLQFGWTTDDSAVLANFTMGAELTVTSGNFNIIGQYQVDGGQLDYADIAATGNATPTGTWDFSTATDLELPDDSVDVGDINATGTPGAGNFLRGDGSWATSTATLQNLSDTVDIDYTGGTIIIGDNSDSFDEKVVSGAITLAADGTTTLNSNSTILTSLAIGADPADAEEIRLPVGGAIAWEDAGTEVTLTHIDTEGLRLNVAHQLQFRDAALSISSADDGHLDFVADVSVDFDVPAATFSGSMAAAGAITGLNSQGADITGNTAHDTVELHGVMYKFTAAATVTLDAAADAGYGACASYRIRDAAEAAVIDPQAGEKINLAGVPLAVGVAITATGAGEYLTVCATTDTDGSGTDGYDVYGPTSGWASE